MVIISCFFIFILFFSYYRSGSSCEKCDQSCELCTGPGPESCKACSPPFLEVQGTKMCVERCPQRFYQLGDICKQCHISCQTCTGAKGTFTAYYSIIMIILLLLLSYIVMCNIIFCIRYTVPLVHLLLETDFVCFLQMPHLRNV